MELLQDYFRLFLFKPLFFPLHQICYSNVRQREVTKKPELVQIVMVSPGTHLVKNHESLSKTIESRFKKQCVPGSFITIQLI